MSQLDKRLGWKRYWEKYNYQMRMNAYEKPLKKPRESGEPRKREGVQK